MTTPDAEFHPLAPARSDVAAGRQCLRGAARSRGAGFEAGIRMHGEGRTTRTSATPLAPGGRTARQPGSRPCLN
jgi:hypothetical protein